MKSKFSLLVFSIIYSNLICGQDITFSNSWHQVNTPSGYIRLGPNNASWAHIYTDRPKFIFDKPIFIIGGELSAYNQADLKLQTDGVSRLTILKSNGFIGINTDNPSAKLHLSGFERNSFHLSRSGDPSKYLSIWQGSGAPVIDAVGSSRMYIGYEYSADIVMAKAGGTVAIGTVDFPSDFKLAVDGKAIMEEVQVEVSTSWPDYVFSDNYQLRTLEETEQYIKEFRHLPNIPTAKEVREDGVALGEMNALLLEKIEELTLHLIQKDHQLSELINEYQNLSDQFSRFENRLNTIERIAVHEE